MIRDITIGQYFPGGSVIHCLDPRIKILLTIAFITILFVISDIFSLCLILVLILVIYKVAKISYKLIFKNLKSMWFIILFTSVVNIFFTEGQLIWKFWKFSVSKEGILFSILLIIRIINMITISSLLTYTTSPIELTHGLEKLMKPLKIFKVPVEDLSMMMTISLRFIPTLINETDKIMLAQKSRGARIDVGNIFQKLKSFIPVIIPLFISAFRAADELAVAMECRLYGIGEKKTSIRQLKIKKIDILAICFITIYFIIIILINNKILF